MNLRNGINSLFEPAGDHVANIVFCHGLFGNPFTTWTDEAADGPNKPFWPKDLLPQDAPNARIYSFGYDADVTGSASLNTVLHHGTNLLNDLANLDAGPSCPYLFIVHSLGGLVVKEALNQSSGASNPRLKSVLDNTHGIIFLGTPHRGSASASYGKIAFTMAKVFAGQSSNTKLLRALEKDSEVLERISRAFYSTWDKHPHLHICSFHEEKEMRKLGVFRMRVVPPESARIGHAREELGSIPEDHRYMAKFRQATDTGYVRISAVIRRWVEQIVKEKDKNEKRLYQRCLSSLNEPESRSRLLQVDPQHSGTFEWLFSDSVPFSRWLADTGQRYGPIFWITGKPGSGKSTCMRFAMKDPRLLQLVPTGYGKPIGYFFHLRGKSHVQKSMHGMLLEMLYQLLSTIPQAFDYIKPNFLQLQKEQRTRKPSWGKGDLKACIEIIVGTPDMSWHSNCRYRLLFFIDALDENVDMSENNEVLNFIHGLSTFHEQNTTTKDVLKICLASRPWPQFQNSLANNPRIPSFAIHEHTRVDIARFTTSSLSRSINPAIATATQHANIRELSEAVIEKGHGVFVWVKFVVRDLRCHLTDGSSMETIRKFVSSLPDELGELYEYTARRIPADYRLETAVAFRILLCSLRPLSLRTLHCATMSCILRSTPDTFADVPEVALKAWLASRTGGLIELAVDYASLGPFRFDRPRPGRHDSVWKVQFLHQTVQEFVHRGMPGLDWSVYTEWWRDLDGNYLIYRAIAADFPPPEPLLGLAKDVFEHLRAVDRALEVYYKDNCNHLGQLISPRGIPHARNTLSELYDRTGLGLAISRSRAAWDSGVCNDTAGKPHGRSLILRRRIHALGCLRSAFTVVKTHLYGMDEEDLSYFMTPTQLATFSRAQVSPAERGFSGAAVFYAALIYQDILQWAVWEVPHVVYFDLMAMAALGPRAVETTIDRRVKMLGRIGVTDLSTDYETVLAFEGSGAVTRGGLNGEVAVKNTKWNEPWYFNEANAPFSPTLAGTVDELMGETRGSFIEHLAALQHHEQADEEDRLRLAEAFFELGHLPRPLAFAGYLRSNEPLALGRIGEGLSAPQRLTQFKAVYQMDFSEFCQRFKGNKWVQLCIRRGLLRQQLDDLVMKAVKQEDSEEKDTHKEIIKLPLLMSVWGIPDARKAFCSPCRASQLRPSGSEQVRLEREDRLRERLTHEPPDDC